MSAARLARTPAVTRVLAAALVLAASVTYFGHVFQAPGGAWRTAGLGDWVDPYFINGLLEQLTFCLRHFCNPASPPMFFPATDTLGYSHGLVLFAPIYAVARLFLPPFLAYTVMLFVVMEAGVLCLYAVCRRFLRLTFIESVVMTTAFATSPNVINLSLGTWAQRASVFLIPPMLWLGLVSMRRRGWQGTAGLWLAGFLGASLLTQDAYTGLFAVLVSGCLGLGYWLIGRRARMPVRLWLQRKPAPDLSSPRRRGAAVAVTIAALGFAWTSVSLPGPLRFEFSSHHHHWERPAVVTALAVLAWLLLRGGVHTKIRWRVAAISRRTWGPAAGAAAGLAVFGAIYVPSFLQNGGFPEDQLLGSLARLQTSQLTTLPFQAMFPYPSARSFVLALAVAGLTWLPWFRTARVIRLGTLWVALVALGVVLVAVQLNGFSLWLDVLAPLPGFSAIRDPGRIVYVFELAAAISGGVLLASLPRERPLRAMLTMLFGVFVVADVSRATFVYRRPIAVFDRYVSAPIAVDATCRSFFIRGASTAYMSRTDNMWSLYANDAAFIATAHGLPTLNGYSALVPPDWNLANPEDGGYLDAVDRWIALHHLQGVCALDIDARTMTPYTPGAR